MSTPRIHPMARTALLAGLAAISVLAACTDDDKRSLGEVDVRESLAGHVSDVLGGQQLDLDGELDCTSTITEASEVDSTCSGTASSGAAVSGTYAGTADIDSETCTAVLVVTVDGSPAVEREDVDCFDVG
jgi:geranylgeranyl pyrophosphate synthase